MSRPRPIHDAAARGFERGAEEYERGRPDFPPAVVETLARECGLRSGATVVDLGAGTGKFTAGLLATGARVTAVEPVAAMRARFSARFPGAPIVDGTAENLPLDDGSIDLVTVAQAFHWFDAVPALDEIGRVLVPGGWLALVWNTHDGSVAWSAPLTEILDRYAGDAPRFRSSDPRWRAALDAHPAFGPVHEATFANPVEVNLEIMLARLSSTSYVSALPDDERAAVLAEATTLLEEGPIAEHGTTFIDGYRTELFWCQRR